MRNWGGDIVSHPKVATHPRNVDDIVAIMKDPETYPSPVRGIGSGHSTTRCGVADNGTVVYTGRMNRIIEVGPDYVTAEAGALYIDVSKELQRHGLQFYVNLEIGNLTIGSACCGGTKDASMPGEFGQVCSYASVIKMVAPSGELLEFTEDDPELLQIMRSSYGLLGIVYEATFKVRPFQPMAVHHTTYSLNEFERQLPSLITRGESMMLYIFPFQNAVTVEYRRYHDAQSSPNHRAWRIRNLVWRTVAPALGYVLTRFIPIRPIRYFLINAFNRVMQLSLRMIVNSQYTIANEQTIRYPAKAGMTKYTFSIWAFPEDSYISVLRAYFEFCRRYYREHGYRCDLLSVGYRVSEDTSSLFSYSFKGNVMTVDPISTGASGWDDFLKAYNDFCSKNGGVPLFNQTKWITPDQAKKAFGDRLEKFSGYRQQYDPDNRLLNEYFEQILA